MVVIRLKKKDFIASTLVPNPKIKKVLPTGQVIWEEANKGDRK